MPSQEDSRLQQIIKCYEAQDYAAAIGTGKTFTKEFPQNGSGWNLLALSYKASGNIPEALRIFKFLVKASPKSEMFQANLGNTYMLIGKINQGISCFKKALKQEPRMLNAIEALGLAYLEIDRNDNARKCFERVIQLDPKHERSLYFLGNMYLLENEHAKAAQFLKKSSFGLSKSHYLECLLCLDRGEEFLNYYKDLSRKGVINPLIGGLVSHAEELYGAQIDNIFCNNSMDHIYVGCVGEEDGFSDKLANKLIKYHHSNKNDYRSQSLLHQGTQSSGNLFLLEEPFVKSLRLSIERQVEQYRLKFQDGNQGFLTRWPDRYELFGWMVSIKSGGNLDAHNHKEGWLSGSFYLSLPERSGEQANDGKIAFSCRGPRYPDGNKTFKKKVVDIKKRDICMFPSSLFHETIPFEGPEERVSFAFDVKPIN